jgi:hypothetical protein
VPRKKSPDARDEVMSARFSKDEAAEVDTARGAEERSVWLRRVAIAAIERLRAPAEPAVTPASAETKEPKTRAKGPCEHRIPPGSYCRRCDRLI